MYGLKVEITVKNIVLSKLIQKVSYIGYDISFKKLSGERLDVNEAVMTQWIAKLNYICKGFDARYLGKCDEIVFFKICFLKNIKPTRRNMSWR